MPIEHLINSYKLILLITEKKTEAVNVYLVSNNGEGVGGGSLRGGGGGGAKKKMRRFPHKQ